MEDDSCLACGATYARKRHDQRFCTSACRYRHRDTATPEGRLRLKMRKATWKQRNLKSCPHCGAAMSHQATMCGSTICSAIHQGRDRCEWPRTPICTPITPTVCVCCERWFIKRPGMENGQHCSTRCRHLASGWMPAQSSLTFGSCARCALTFVRRAGMVGQFCSRRCAQGTHKRRRETLKRSTGRDGERFTIRQVAERDGWTCHLCGKRVPDQQWSGHPMDATVDHLLPLSCGGTDTLANVKLAHFACNTRRGVGGVVQLAMV